MSTEVREGGPFALESLDYGRLKSLLGRYVRGRRARELLDQTAPSTDREDLESRHSLVAEATAYLRDHGVAFPEIPALDPVLGRIGPGATTLEIEEIGAVAELVADVTGLRKQWDGEARDFPLLASEARRLPDLSDLGRFLGSAIEHGEIREDFSPTLKRLRRDLEVSRSRLNRKLESILRASERDLQDAIITVRNGRYVIPVRTERQRGVQGIVHGSSSSGATVFMEPLETLDMNNALVRLAEEEDREVRRILGELTDRICAHEEQIGAAAEVRARLELLFGIARWGRDFDCVSPRFSDGDVWLRKARHPLIEDRLRGTHQTMVPLTLELGGEERVLVISGPNAGGKTVVLKTLGLFALMAQSGFPVPADDARLPLADQVMADIGDHQSIANQLSTFSAHILEISRMVDSAAGGSLVLLDEIGSNTEPSEGAALGIAVLEALREAGCLVVATTHYNRLKMYAETTPGVRNAAMAFNEETLEPTYALIDGLVGPSSGLKIAERLRLRRDLIELARSRLDTAELEAARFVEELKTRIAGLEDDKRRLEAERREFESWKTRMRGQIAREKASRLEELEARLDDLVAGIRRRVEDSLRTADSKTVRRLERTLGRAEADARRQLSSEVLARETPAPTPGPAVGSEAGGASDRRLPEPGLRVRVRSLGKEGPVLAVFGDHAEVAIGHMKVRRPLEDLDVLDGPVPARASLPRNVHFVPAREGAGTSQLNLVGLRREEAIARLEKFLDDALLDGFPTVWIIHGSGQGILRQAVVQVLGAHPRVLRFDSAPQDQGGSGVTVATLDS